MSSAAVSTSAKSPACAQRAPRGRRPRRRRTRDHRRERRAVRAGGLELASEPHVAQRVRDLRLGHDVGELLGAQQRHRAHRDAAGLHHREPARGEHRRVRRAQQHAVARNETEILDQHVGDAVGAIEQVGVGPAHAGRPRRSRCGRPSRARSRGRAAPSAQFSRSGYRELRQLENEFGPGSARRQVVARERVDVRRVAHHSTVALVPFHPRAPHPRARMVPRRPSLGAPGGCEGARAR